MIWGLIVTWVVTVRYKSKLQPWLTIEAEGEEVLQAEITGL